MAPGQSQASRYSSTGRTPNQVERRKGLQVSSSLVPKMRGSDAPLDGKCGSRLKHDLDIEGMMRYCIQEAGKGTSHLHIGKCSLHGGSTPTHEISAARVQIKKDALTLLHELGEPEPIGDPVEELLDVASMTVQWKNVCVQKLNELRTFEYTDNAGVERPKAAIELFERALDRVVVTLVQLEKLNLMDKKLAMEAEHGAMLAEALSKIILHNQLNLDDDQIQLARALVNDTIIELTPTIFPGMVHDIVYAEVIDD